MADCELCIFPCFKKKKKKGKRKKLGLLKDKLDRAERTREKRETETLERQINKRNVARRMCETHTQQLTHPEHTSMHQEEHD